MPSAYVSFQLVEIEPLVHGDIVDACTVSRVTRHREQKKVWFDHFDTKYIDIITQQIVPDFDYLVSCDISIECNVCHYTECRSFELKGYRVLTPIVGLTLDGKPVYKLDEELYDDYYIDCRDCLESPLCDIHSTCDSECEFRYTSFLEEGSPRTAEEVYESNFPETPNTDPTQPASLSVTVRDEEGNVVEDNVLTGTLAEIIARLEQLARD